MEDNENLYFGLEWTTFEELVTKAYTIAKQTTTDE